MRKLEIVSFRTYPEVKKALLDICEKEDQTLSKIVNRIIQEYLEKEAK